ncbi:LLM class flavin-dependent oxidoreductase [Olivibacter sitiensis]|uniref:LLM class flavin-dependent oxidoreductase n=1 Tax=Olivibacter sitiensis TaxID=376470 RepID=UPI000413B7F2|nr:LLM class flavin-dependent oxidoreductase [Olivibacter sitiensis]
MNRISVSALDLAVIFEGGDAAAAIARTVKVAQHIEKLGYERIWLAEHHNMPNIASSATAVLIGHVAGKTSTLRVGSGGIMLPNHSPLAVAEQFGTLETIYPGRIDLGLGRAPGTDQATAMALRRNNVESIYSFPSDIKDLQVYFSSTNEHARVRAFPGEGLNIPIWILGSSTDSAYLAAEMGLPYAFAAHFAPQQFRRAIQLYRQNFKPSPYLDKPKVLACVNVIAADTDDEARFLATSMYQLFLGIVTNNRKPLQPPRMAMDPVHWPEELRQAVQQMTSCTFIGNKESLFNQLSTFVESTEVNEIMVTGNIFDEQAKLHSLEILKQVVDDINALPTE